MSRIDIIDRENRIVAMWLLHYDERKKEYELEVERILNKGEHSGVINLRDIAPGNIGDSTGNRAAELVDKLARKKAWLDLIEEVEQKLPWKMRLFLQLRREARTRRGKTQGRPAWLPYVQWKYAQEIAARMGKKEENVWVNSPTTLYNWWDKIVNYTARLAAKRGLL